MFLVLTVHSHKGKERKGRCTDEKLIINETNYSELRSCVYNKIKSDYKKDYIIKSIKNH